MEEATDHETSIRDVWKLVLAVLGVVAVVQELRKPKDERTWHGNVIGFVPYDYRFPTIARFKRVYWSPDGSLFGSKVFGVGWAMNIGAAVARARSISGGAPDESDAPDAAPSDAEPS